jgi:hypothetical protein
MSGQLHQINVEYSKAEDRVLLRLNTTDKKELRLWLTRRFVKRVWNALQELLEKTGLARSVADPALRRAMVGFDQEKATPQQNFAKAFEGDAAEYPLGAAPVLLTGLSYTPANGAEGLGKLVLRAASGHEIGMPAADVVLHSLTKMLAGVVAATDWDLKLDPGYPVGDPSAKPAQVH